MFSKYLKDIEGSQKSDNIWQIKQDGKEVQAARPPDPHPQGCLVMVSE